ncbi:MAG: 50S ribosomal protein L29 [Proteobacteria bacterium]|nr:50S ribosomal protein L29 [Pseudomonadota bacterium]
MKHREIRKELEDFRKGDVGALNEELANLKKEQFNLRFQQATGQLEKSSRMRDGRRQGARTMKMQRGKTPQQKV